MKKMFFLLGACALSLLLNYTNASAGVVRIVTSCGTEVYTYTEFHKDFDDLMDTVRTIEEIECGDTVKI